MNLGKKGLAKVLDSKKSLGYIFNMNHQNEPLKICCCAMVITLEVAFRDVFSHMLTTPPPQKKKK